MSRYLTAGPATAILLAVVALTGCSETDQKTVAKHEVSAATLLTLGLTEVPVRYVTSGTITSDHRVAISSRLSGYIRDMKVREGDRVEVGQVLVKVDPVDARQLLVQAEADLSDAKLDLQRYNELLKAEAVSEQQVAKVRLRYKVARSQVEQARNQLSYAEVRSPVAGVVVEKRLSQGDLAAPGVTLLTLEDPGHLLVETHVSEKHISSIKEGDVVDLEVPAVGRTYPGRVRQIVQAADPVSHQFLVKVALPEADGASMNNVHPGMYVQTGFHIGVRKALLLPVAAINNRFGLHGVYILDGQGIAHYRQVRLGKQVSSQDVDQVEILAGLESGDVIAWQGDPALKSGMKIKSRTTAGAVGH